MSRFFSGKYSNLAPYVPGEQPRDRKYIKLNTNESPFPPSPGVVAAAGNEAYQSNLYSDPECISIREALADFYGVKKEQVIATNGSDEVLNFAFMAFGDDKSPLLFPDITYGFYPVFAELNHIPYDIAPLREDFTVNLADYLGNDHTVVIANPNAPTGLALPLSDIEKILRANPDHVVVVDEAYVDFGGESAISLVDRYDNLLVTGTFSKSRSMAGARLGFGIGNAELMADLNRLRYSTNPYNVNRMTMEAGAAAIREHDYYAKNMQTIIQNREATKEKLEALGFQVTDSKTNFLFAKTDAMDGEALYLALKERGILVRHFTSPRIRDWNRITVGTAGQMDALVDAIRDILKGEPV